MTKLLYDEATAYRRVLFVLIEKLMPKPSDGSLDAMLQEMTEAERRDWPAQRVIDMAMGAADAALYREKNAHELAQIRAKSALQKVEALANALDSLSRQALESSELQRNKTDRAFQGGESASLQRARVHVEGLREVLAGVLGVSE